MSKLPYPDTHDEVEALKRSYLKMRKIEKMHTLYGRQGTEQCKNCAHFFKTNWDQATQHFKCKLYGVTGGEGTDWRAHYDACGKFSPVASSSR